MKTANVEINDELTQMFGLLIDVGLKHPQLGGARLAVQGAVCLQWIQLVQTQFNAMGNGAMPVDAEDA